MSVSPISHPGLPVGLWGDPIDIVRASRAELRMQFPKAAPIPNASPPAERILSSSGAPVRFDEF